ncbi:unnamed protein product, partial [Rotaria sp. Silwood1]
STFFDTSSTSRTNPRSSNQTSKKTSSNITTRSTSSSAPIKTPKPITSIGTTTTTWVNSNRSNRAISSSST